MLDYVPRPAALAALAALVAGVVVLAVAGEDETWAIIAMLLLGAGGIGAMGIAFYAAGRSEDEERKRGTL